MSDYFDRIERQLVQRVHEAPRRSWFSASLGQVVPVASALVVVAVVAAFIGVNGDRPSPPAASDRGSLVLAAVPVNPRVALGPSIDASIVTLRRRLHIVFPQVRVSRAGDNVVVVGASRSTRAAILELAAPGNLSFFDWEANTLTTAPTPDGTTVAVGLRTNTPAAITISQGGAGAAPGEPGAGAMSLFDAVKLAARQPASPAPGSPDRFGREYYLFGTPGSPACAAAAGAHGVGTSEGQRCLLAGPDTSLAALDSELPPGVTAADGRLVLVPSGTVVLQAANAGTFAQIAASSPTARFYVLKDNAVLGGAEITHPRPSAGPAGDFLVEFGFTPRGRKEFHAVTRAIVRRGAQLSSFGQTYNQHFAIALDNQLITVPSIDFKQYPDGILGSAGADISGGLTRQSARILSALLRYGPLTVKLAARPSG